MKTPEEIAHDVWQELWTNDKKNAWNQPDEFAERKIAAAIRVALKECKSQ
jgi:hypothetical protein